MDGTVNELLVLAAKQVNGRQKRIFLATVCEKLCDGSARKAEERFGWSREAVAKGLLERSGEPEEEVRLQRGGVKPSEVRNPQLAIDIRLIVEPHTHSDPELKSSRIYTNFSAAEVRSALSEKGYTGETVSRNGGSSFGRNTTRFDDFKSIWIMDQRTQVAEHNF